MYVALRRHDVNASKARPFETSGQDYVSIEPAVAQLVHGGKDHPDLKPNAGLGGRNLHWTTFLYEGIETFVE
jgi:hypothetical protein